MSNGYVKFNDMWVPLAEDQSPPSPDELRVMNPAMRARAAGFKRLANGALALGQVWEEPIDDCPVWSPAP